MLVAMWPMSEAPPHAIGGGCYHFATQLPVTGQDKRKHDVALGYAARYSFCMAALNLAVTADNPGVMTRQHIKYLASNS